MPDMDGFETAALIRQNERTKSLPIEARSVSLSHFAKT